MRPSPSNDPTLLLRTRAGFAAEGGTPATWPARPAALRSEGEAGHLSVPVRRPFADRTVRQQAAPAGLSRAGSARIDSQRPAPHRHVRVAGELSGGAVEILHGAARPVRCMEPSPPTASSRGGWPNASSASFSFTNAIGI